MKFSKWFLPLVFSLTILLMVWLSVSDQSPFRVQSRDGDTTLWNTGWQVEQSDGDLRVVTLPTRLDSDEFSMENILPEDFSSSALLYMKTNYQQVTAEVDGEPVPITGIVSLPDKRLTNDLPWTTLTLTPEMKGKTLRLTFSQTGSKPFVEVYSVRLGGLAEIRLALLSRALPSMILSLLVLIFALALFIFAALEARRFGKGIPQGYLYLIGFLVLSGIWFYTDTDISGIGYIASQAFFDVNLYSYLLMPIPFFLFIRFMQPTFKRICSILNGLLLGNILLYTVLMLAGSALLWVSLSISHALIAAAAIVTPAMMLSRKNARTIKSVLYNGVFITAFTALVTLALYYLLPIDDNSSVFRYGVLVMVMALTVDLLRANEDIVIEANQIEQLRIREEEYRVAARQSDKHVLRFDVELRTLMMGEEPSPLFNGEHDIPDMPEALIREGYVAEESIADFRAFYRDILAGEPKGTSIALLRGKDGQFAWYRSDYTLIYADDGRPSQAIISFSDITEQREKELAYQKWKQTYTDMSPDSMHYYEYNLTRDMLTGEAGAMIPSPPLEAKRTLSLLIDYLAEHHVAQEDQQRFRSFFEHDRLLEAFDNNVRNGKLEFRRMEDGGGALWTVASVQLFPDPYSNDVQAFLLIQDEDEAKRDEMKVRDRSTHDPLTGLLNRAAFEEQLTQLFTFSDENAAHALMMIDVDGFKRVNDTFGHQFGDLVLIDIANNLRTTMRSGDLISRIGGDEYMVCLKNIQEGTDFLEKRATFICQTFAKRFDNDVSITGSVGVSLYPRDGRTFPVLYRKADQALYLAKQRGKNRFVLYRDDMDHAQANEIVSPTAYGATNEPNWATLIRDDIERTILIVSDTEENYDRLSGIFSDDYRVLMARDADACRALLAQEPRQVSAVLLDISAPGADGLDLLKRLQANPDWASIPVLITVAQDAVEVSFNAIEAGAMDFVRMPYEPWLVKLRVKNVIRKRETEELRSQNQYLLVQKSDEIRHQSELRYIADHDVLTNICNKAAFYRKTKAMLDKAPDTEFVMISFDIEKFRLINDIFGHEEGDRLLRYIAQRMQTLYAGSATYSRIDADNFTLCMPYDPDQIKQQSVEFDRELKDYGLPFEILLVFGLYIIDDRSLPVSIMHDRAEMAKRTVKGNYVQRYAFYDDQLRKALLTELEIVNDMNMALQNHQFELYLQPKCLLSNGEIVGAEALVRWNHPTRGLLLPGAFVPIFEKNGFIMKMDAYIWEQVCILQRRWMDRYGGRPPLALSMNVSRVNIYNPALVGTLCQLADRYGVPRRYIELEITESAYTEDPKLLSERIAALRKEGFFVEMDDFGSAYSSLNMLKEIEVDLLKLDMRFLYGDDQNGRGGIILSSVVRMARYLALPIVAEGVETVEQARFLASIGCTQAQGYYFYRPMPVDEFENLLIRHPLIHINDVTQNFSESSVRRVWSIDGDFSLMLATIPCAASLCEMIGDNIEILRINDEYLAVTHDHAERIYTCGSDVRTMTTKEGYQCLQVLFRRALETRGISEGNYLRIGEDGSHQKYRLKVKYLSSDATRSLFFVTYLPLPDDTEPPAIIETLVRSVRKRKRFR
ncbi:MAG: diguanylate cyclase [Eubacteriales bacterium]|nr:diguanylate cyclase [Eubacteriales bacterium]